MQQIQCIIKNDPEQSCFVITGIGPEMRIEYSTDVNFTPFVRCLAGLIEEERAIQIVNSLVTEGKSGVVYEALVSIIDKFNSALVMECP